LMYSYNHHRTNMDSGCCKSMQHLAKGAQRFYFAGR
jgi:hypothetical protein